MQTQSELSINIHIELNPPWSLGKTGEIVWRFRARCINDARIWAWFEQTIVDTDQPAQHIFVDEIPDHLDRDNWQ